MACINELLQKEVSLIIYILNSSNFQKVSAGRYHDIERYRNIVFPRLHLLLTSNSARSGTVQKILCTVFEGNAWSLKKKITDYANPRPSREIKFIHKSNMMFCLSLILYVMDSCMSLTFKTNFFLDPNSILIRFHSQFYSRKNSVKKTFFMAPLPPNWINNF